MPAGCAMVAVLADMPQGADHAVDGSDRAADDQPTRSYFERVRPTAADEEHLPLSEKAAASADAIRAAGAKPSWWPDSDAEVDEVRALAADLGLAVRADFVAGNETSR